MKPFLAIAIPHEDILKGRLEMDIFAADLWEVFKGRAPEEYKDPYIFFKKTYLTQGLKNLINITEKRLKGEGGDPIIQLKTPFGGGKTHSLIALYHKAKEWNVKAVVFSGDKFSVGEEERTLWEEIEYQLEGKVEKFRGKLPPGGEKLRSFLENHQPLLLLFDELHTYTVKALGLKVGDSNLADQTITFLQDLTGVVRTLEKTMLIVSLPSSNPYSDATSEKLLQSLQAILGRVETIYTPVEEEEVSLVIKRRLFSQIDEKEARGNIEEFLDYAEREKILPIGTEKSVYREKFIKSFPFQPEVIDILYKRWGSFPTFQRTRGVLRLLALVVNELKDSYIPFIRLSDINLKNDEIRMELIKHIGSEYESVIYADITSEDSGAKKVDKSLGDAYRSYYLGTKTVTTIFMYSFSAGPERGVSENEVKLCTAHPDFPSSILGDVILKLKENLFYLSDEGLYFTSQPNLNRMLIQKMESIDERELIEEEKKLLEDIMRVKKYFDIYIWPKNSVDIPDSKNLKLIILKNKDKAKEIFENVGEKTRIYKNVLFFLAPMESERLNFERSLRKKLALEKIERESAENLSEIQKKEVKEKLKQAEKEITEGIRNLYRIILVPSRENFKEINLGIGTYGKNIIEEIYQRLKNEGEILEKLSPITIKEKYLKTTDYVETKSILEALYRTPGEIRISNEEVLREAILEGCKEGYLGIGYLSENREPKVKYFKEKEEINFQEREIITKEPIQESPPPPPPPPPPSPPLSPPKGETYTKIYLKLDVPSIKWSDVYKIIKFLNSKFNSENIKIEISFENGEIPKSEYEGGVKEALFQTGVNIEKEELK